MANTMALQSVERGERNTKRTFLVTLSATYVQAVSGANTGEVLIPNSASNPNNLSSPAASQYDRAYVLQSPGGFNAEILPGADSVHWLLKVFGTTPGTELAAGAYPAGVTGDAQIFVVLESKNYS